MSNHPDTLALAIAATAARLAAGEDAPINPDLLNRQRPMVYTAESEARMKADAEAEAKAKADRYKNINTGNPELDAEIVKFLEARRPPSHPPVNVVNPQLINQQK